MVETAPHKQLLDQRSRSPTLLHSLTSSQHVIVAMWHVCLNQNVVKAVLLLQQNIQHADQAILTSFPGDRLIMQTLL